MCLLMVAVGAGCKPAAETSGKSASPAASTEVNPVGDYRLVEVDGKKVPCAVEHDGHSMTIEAGSFSIAADGTCKSQMMLAGRPAAIERAATYTQAGSELTMKWQGFGMTVGTVEGDTFRMNNEGMVLTYQK